MDADAANLDTPTGNTSTLSTVHWSRSSQMDRGQADVALADTEFLEANTPTRSALALNLRLKAHLASAGSASMAPSTLWAVARIASKIECANKEDQPHIPADQLPAVQDEECKLLVKLWGLPKEQRFVTSEARKPPLSPGLYEFNAT